MHIDDAFSVDFGIPYVARCPKAGQHYVTLFAYRHIEAGRNFSHVAL
jgi:hypothetical protein